LALICSIRIHSQEIRRLSAFSPPYFLRPEPLRKFFIGRKKRQIQPNVMCNTPKNFLKIWW
jgi:hypothetical protein